MPILSLHRGRRDLHVTCADRNCTRFGQELLDVMTREILLLGDYTLLVQTCVIGRVVDAEQLGEEADKVIARLAANAPVAKAIKALINREMEFREHIEHADVDALVDIAAMTLGRDGCKYRKRAPNFTGLNRYWLKSVDVTVAGREGNRWNSLNTEGEIVRVPADAMRQLLKDVRWGFDEDACQSADVLYADLRGYDTHGVEHAPHLRGLGAKRGD